MSKRRKEHKRLIPTWGLEEKDRMPVTSERAFKEIKARKKEYAFSQMAPVRVLVRNGKPVNEIVQPQLPPKLHGAEASKAVFVKRLKRDSALLRMQQAERAQRRKDAELFRSQSISGLPGVSSEVLVSVLPPDQGNCSWNRP